MEIVRVLLYSPTASCKQAQRIYSLTTTSYSACIVPNVAFLTHMQQSSFLWSGWHQVLCIVTICHENPGTLKGRKSCYGAGSVPHFQFRGRSTPTRRTNQPKASSKGLRRLPAVCGQLYRRGFILQPFSSRDSANCPTSGGVKHPSLWYAHGSNTRISVY